MPDGVSNDTQITQGMAWQTATRSVSGSGGYGLEMEDFYKLLAAQLRYQDMDNPMDTSEMMAQMVQTQMIQTITQLNQMSYITYAASMIGKEVVVGVVDQYGFATNEFKTGVVEGVNITANPPTLFIDGKRYELSQLVSIGKLPLEEDKKDPEVSGKPEDPDGPKEPDEEGKEPGDVDGDDKDPDKVGSDGDGNKAEGADKNEGSAEPGTDVEQPGGDDKVDGSQGENVSKPENGPSEGEGTGESEGNGENTDPAGSESGEA